MSPALTLSAGLAMLLCAAIFGFFYAWVCSTMWGLDTLAPQVAIEAMNGMNASVRNAVFAPAFFGTPLALLVTAGLALTSGNRAAGVWFGLAALVYLLGAFAVTMMVNVPMNEALMAGGVPEDPAQARAIWTAYSAKWQVYNIARTLASGVTFAMGLIGIVCLARG